jgi:hypothetical protein
MSDAIVSDEPHDRLTELAARMTECLGDAGNEDVRAIIFLTDHQRGGIETYGYDDTTEAIADLFIHLRALFRANGQDLDVVSIPNSPADL